MTAILVPGPPKESFNKHRPLSDLLLSQVKHFQHVEAKLDPSLRTNFSPRDVLTENTAAQYIAQMTNILRGLAPVKAAPDGPIPVPLQSKVATKPIRPSSGIPLAAAADPTVNSKPGSATPTQAEPNKRKSPRRSGRKP
ncbi:hypothetical protein P8936_15530 [Edaphobacter paludis]|uniref:Uncharacterized protein n=1 Tax=Edaphobacter paludis TaxID=3035702 RepID=A0AAU7CXI3_9BACT